MNLEERNLEWTGSWRRVGLGLGLVGVADEGEKGAGRAPPHLPRPHRWLEPTAEGWVRY